MRNSATADELLKEYKACESPDYISYVSVILECAYTFADYYLQGSPEGEQAS